MLAWEAGLLALYAIVPSLALGVGYGALTIRAVPEFDTVTLPYGQLALTAAGTLLAAALPARRTARTSPMTALRST